MNPNKNASVLQVDSILLRNRNRKINKVEFLSQTIIITSYIIQCLRVKSLISRSVFSLVLFKSVSRYLMKNQPYYNRLGKLATRYNMFLMFKRADLDISLFL